MQEESGKFWKREQQGLPNIKTLHAAAAAAAAKSPQSCPTLCDPIDGSPSGSPVPGILQARTLERVKHSIAIIIKFGDGIWLDKWVNETEQNPKIDPKIYENIIQWYRLHFKSVRKRLIVKNNQWRDNQIFFWEKIKLQPYFTPNNK